MIGPIRKSWNKWHFETAENWTEVQDEIPVIEVGEINEINKKIFERVFNFKKMIGKYSEELNSFDYDSIYNELENLYSLFERDLERRSQIAIELKSSKIEKQGDYHERVLNKCNEIKSAFRLGMIRKTFRATSEMLNMLIDMLINVDVEVFSVKTILERDGLANEQVLHSLCSLVQVPKIDQKIRSINKELYSFLNGVRRYSDDYFRLEELLSLLINEFSDYFNLKKTFSEKYYDEYSSEETNFESGIKKRIFYFKETISNRKKIVDEEFVNRIIIPWIHNVNLVDYKKYTLRKVRDNLFESVQTYSEIKDLVHDIGVEKEIESIMLKILTVFKSEVTDSLIQLESISIDIKIFISPIEDKAKKNNEFSALKEDLLDFENHVLELRSKIKQHGVKPGKKTQADLIEKFIEVFNKRYYGNSV